MWIPFSFFPLLRVQQQQTWHPSGGEPWAEPSSVTACQAALSWKWTSVWGAGESQSGASCQPASTYSGHVLDGHYKMWVLGLLSARAFSWPCLPLGDWIGRSVLQNPVSGDERNSIISGPQLLPWCCNSTVSIPPWARCHVGAQLLPLHGLGLSLFLIGQPSVAGITLSKPRALALDGDSNLWPCRVLFGFPYNAIFWFIHSSFFHVPNLKARFPQ